MPRANDVRALAPGVYFARSGPSAVSRKPMGLPDTLVYELHGLTKEEIMIVEGEGNGTTGIWESP
jgi:hypothetical protein